MARTSHNPDIKFLRHIGYALIVATTMAGAVTLSLTISESNSVTIAATGVSDQVAMRLQPLE
jgi:hypothetical protein